MSHKKEVAPPTAKHRVHRDLDAEISNTLYDDFDKFENFFSSHWKAFCWGGAAVVLLVAAWGIGTLAYQGGENAKYKQLNSAETIDALVAAIKESGSGTIGNDARLRLSTMLSSAGNYADAISQLDDVLATDCPTAQRLQVELTRAYLLERNNKAAEAAQAFAAFATRTDANSEMLAEANYNAGRLYAMLGDTANAVKYLEQARQGSAVTQVINGKQMPFFRMQASCLLNELLAKAN